MSSSVFLSNIDVCNQQQDKESAQSQNTDSPVSNLLPSVPSVSTDNSTNIYDSRLEMIAIIKKRMKALTLLTKSETILSEINIAITEFEMKLELNKLNGFTNFNDRGFKSPEHSEDKLTSKKTQSQEDYDEASNTNNISHQNSLEHRNECIMEDASHTPQPIPEHFSPNLSTSEYNKASMTCSIPINKILLMQNLSSVGKQIISSSRTTEPRYTGSAHQPMHK